MDEPVSKTSPSNEEVHLLDYLIILAKHSRMIIFTSIALTVLFYLYLFIQPNKYTSITRLLPPQQNKTLSAQLLDIMAGGPSPGGISGSTGSGLGGMAAGLLGLKSPSDLYVAMLGCDTVSDCIIDRFKLRKLYKGKYIEDVQKTLRKNAKISVGRKDGVINIEVTDKERQRAAAMANAFVEELEKLLKRLSVTEAEDRLAFLEKERTQAAQNLTKAEEALRTFAEQKGVVQLDTQTRGTLEYIARLRAEIDAKEVQIQVLRQQATPSNYDVIRLETELKGLKDKLRTSEAQWDQVCAGDVCLPSSKVPALGLEYIRLYREAKFQEGLYQLFTKMAEIARLDMVKDVTVIQVLDRAKPPERRSNKRVIPTLLVGFIAFIMMIAVAFGRERWQKDKITEEDSNRIALIITYLKPWRDYARKLLLIIKRK